MEIPLNEVLEGLNSSSWRILEYINENPNAYLKSIQEGLGISREKALKEISRLEGALLIKSEKDPGDSRQLTFIVTIYGEEALKNNK